jgi:hypothetical protein
LEEELQKICLLEARTNASLMNVDEAPEIYKQIQLELLQDLEDTQLEAILNMQDFEREMATSSSAATTTTQLVCPVCMKGSLQESSSQIFCSRASLGSCGFRVSTAVVRMNLGELAGRLQTAVAEHSCDSVPQFIFENSSAESLNLIIMCEKCRFMRSII